MRALEFITGHMVYNLNIRKSYRRQPPIYYLNIKVKVKQTYSLFSEFYALILNIVMLIEYVNTAFPKIQLENYKTMTSPNERMLLILYTHISNYFCYKVFTLDI